MIRFCVGSIGYVFANTNKQSKQIYVKFFIKIKPSSLATSCQNFSDLEVWFIMLSRFENTQLLGISNARYHRDQNRPIYTKIIMSLKNIYI